MGSCPPRLQAHQIWRVFVGRRRKNWCRIAEKKIGNAGGMGIDAKVVGSWVGFRGSDVNWVDVSLTRGGLIYDGYHSHFLALKP